MIGYYIHHHGRGHLHRAHAIASELGRDVTGLSSLARPSDWPGDWVQLARDDEAEQPVDVRAGGVFHWAPLRDGGFADRMSQLSAWIHRVRPRAVVVDVSVEVALLCRLHGVPVVTVAMPGERGDLPHSLGYAASSAIIGAWPEAATAMLRTSDTESALTLPPVTPVGGISRFMGRPRVATPDERQVLVLLGRGGDDVPQGVLERAQQETPEWNWRVLGGGAGEWVDDPWELICAATVVVSHAGQNSIADVAAARRPAVIVPQSRPHGEQKVTARVLARGDWPAVVVEEFPRTGWQHLLEHASRLEGDHWARWTDGQGAQRAAAVVREIAEPAP